MKRVMSKPRQVTWGAFFAIEGDDVFDRANPKYRTFVQNRIGTGARVEMLDGTRYVLLGYNPQSKKYDKREGVRATRRTKIDGSYVPKWKHTKYID